MEDRDLKVEDDRGCRYQRQTGPGHYVLSTLALSDDLRTEEWQVLGVGVGQVAGTGEGLKIQNIFEVSAD